MKKRVGVIAVNTRARLINLDTTLPDTDVTAIDLSHIPDVKPGEVLQVTVEGGRVLEVERVPGVQCPTNLNSV